MLLEQPVVRLRPTCSVGSPAVAVLQRCIVASMAGIAPVYPSGGAGPGRSRPRQRWSTARWDVSRSCSARTCPGSLLLVTVWRNLVYLSAVVALVILWWRRDVAAARSLS